MMATAFFVGQRLCSPRHFTKGGGVVLDTLKVPLANPDFAPFLQRARDLRPDTLFVFVPAGQAGTLARQFAERGLDKSGIRLIGPGDIVDDDDLPGTGDTFLGVVTAGVYSAAHPSGINKDYVAAYAKAAGHRANFISLGGYDGMHLIYSALEKTRGNTDADAVVAAMKGMKWESPRGPISIDPPFADLLGHIPYRETTVLREPVGENAPASRLDAPARLLRVRQKRKTKILRGAQSAEHDSDELGSAKRYEGRHLLQLALDVRPGRQPIGELTAAPEPRPSQRGC